MKKGVDTVNIHTFFLSQFPILTAYLRKKSGFFQKLDIDHIFKNYCDIPSKSP